MATELSKEENSHSDHYIGIDVGTGSARACIMNAEGEIVGLASENIGLWQPQTGYYEQSTTDIWRCICNSIREALGQQKVDPSTIRGIGFDATCSLAVFSRDTDEPICVTGPDFSNSDGKDRNVILWLDHRPEEETKKINATGHNLLKYVGGTMSIEMEIPKVLWLKNNMPKELFDRCKFFDLTDALTHMATGVENRSYCSVVCKQGFVPVGVDGSVKGWQEDFLTNIGLQDLCEDDFKRMGGVDSVKGQYLTAGDRVGTLSAKAAAAMGLPEGIPVGSGVIDAYAGWIGTVGAQAPLSGAALSSSGSSGDVSQAFTRLAAVAGTSTCHLAMSPKPVFVPGVWGPYRDVLIPEYWLAEGGQSATGELLKYVLETHPAYNSATEDAKKADKNIYDFLNSHLDALSTSSSLPHISWLGKHFFFYGDLWGNRSPVADPSMRGALVGLSPDRSIDSLALHYYAALEFIALQTRHIIDSMNTAGHDIHSIFMSGSQCQNPLLMSLMATACNVPVVIPKYVHAAVVHGAAMLGVKAATGENLWGIMTRLSKPGSVVRPLAEEDGKGEVGGKVKELLGVKYKIFLEMSKTQGSYRAMVDEVIGGKS